MCDCNSKAILKLKFKCSMGEVRKVDGRATVGYPSLGSLVPRLGLPQQQLGYPSPVVLATNENESPLTSSSQK